MSTEELAANADTPLEQLAPEHEEVAPIRQWVTLRDAALDVRVGMGISDRTAADLKSAVGRPHGCALLHEAGAPAELVERLRRELLDQGFGVRVDEFPQGACDLATAASVAELLGKHHITGDDLVVAVGGSVVLSLASWACARWCGGVSLAQVPTDLVAAITAGTTPRALDLPGFSRVLTQDGTARFGILDVSFYALDAKSEECRLAYAHMVATAMADSDKAFERLWDRVDDLMAADPHTTVAQLADTVKGRGKVISSTALATRQSIAYGTELAYAIEAVAPGVVPASVRLADGMRFSARLAAAQDQFEIDDVLAQDELFERLGLGTTSIELDPEALCAVLTSDAFMRANRLMVALPRALGRVRPSMVSEELLLEHLTAWCGARPQA